MTDTYRPLDVVVIRVPLLPFGVFDDLDGDLTRHLTEEVRTAIAIASAEFDRVLDAAPDDRATATTRRYLARMSTRPTPFGLFAGVGLAQLGDRTTLELAAGPRPRRTRPDAARLAAFAAALEQDPAIRSELTVVANSSARWRAGRIVLAERAATVPVPTESATVPTVAEPATVPTVGHSPTAATGNGPVAVSVRATGVVRRALAMARDPIRYADLVDRLVAVTPGADHRRVEGLLDELCRQTLLLTELRPSPTHLERADIVRDRVSSIGPAAAAAQRLAAVLDAARDFDAGPPTAAGYRAAAQPAIGLAPATGPALQVDSGLRLSAATITEQVALEAARGAGLLLRMSPTPHGPSHLAGYRRTFESRYGSRGEVGILELLDPITGLGPPPPPAAGRLDPGRSAERAATLLSLATSALRDQATCVELDENLLRRLESADQATVSFPPSVELTVAVVGATREAVDRGQFELIVGPSVGSGSAGRMLGRFADLVPGATDALQRIADDEATVAPGVLFAELCYAPRSARQINVATRPNARSHEIAVGVSAATDPEHTIPLDELVAFVRDGRLRLRWSTTGQEVVVTAGHMLNSSGAPALARFLSEIGRDGRSQLTGFSWGPAAGFPRLPRVRSGRVVLSLAQWRIDPGDLGGPDSDADRFRDLLEGWRERWHVPSRLAIAAGDRRLALDLDRPYDVAELRSEVRMARAALTVTELYPDTTDLWLTDSDGRRYTAEYVVPLIRRAAEPEAPDGPPRSPTAPDRRPLGSDWLFVKLYTAGDLEDDLLAGPVRELLEEVHRLGVTGSFFLRYDDPERHIRLRLHGAPDLLLTTVLPRVTAWANELLSDGITRRWAVDTYERELDRFGGPAGTDAVERFFIADTGAVLELLADRMAGRNGLDSLPLAVLTIDALISGFGLDLGERAGWASERGGPRRESGADYRATKADLRPALADRPAPSGRPAPDRTNVAREVLRRAAADLRAELDRLAAAGPLTVAPTDLLSSLTHLHLNRLIAASRPTERRVYGLLGRLYSGLARPRHRP